MFLKNDKPVKEHYSHEINQISTVYQVMNEWKNTNSVKAIRFNFLTVGGMKIWAQLFKTNDVVS